MFRAALVMIAIAGIAVSILAAPKALAQSESAIDIGKARPLNSEELYRLYNSRSWLWKAGAGHFSVKERRFSAWSNENASPSYGIGRWFITDPGKLCFRAVWRAETGAARALTCFGHREKDGVIYQRREPNGQWYVFRSAPLRSGDEAAKLRYGDYVAGRLNRLETAGHR